MEMEIPQRSLAMESVIRQHTPMICCTIRYQEPIAQGETGSYSYDLNNCLEKVTCPNGKNDSV